MAPVPQSVRSAGPARRRLSAAASPGQWGASPGQWRASRRQAVRAPTARRPPPNARTRYAQITADAPKTGDSPRPNKTARAHHPLLDPTPSPQSCGTASLRSPLPPLPLYPLPSLRRAQLGRSGPAATFLSAQPSPQITVNHLLPITRLRTCDSTFPARLLNPRPKSPFITSFRAVPFAPRNTRNSGASLLRQAQASARITSVASIPFCSATRGANTRWPWPSVPTLFPPLL